MQLFAVVTPTAAVAMSCNKPIFNCPGLTDSITWYYFSSTPETRETAAQMCANLGVKLVEWKSLAELQNVVSSAGLQIWTSEPLSLLAEFSTWLFQSNDF
jgi:hypothetical protein